MGAERIHQRLPLAHELLRLRGIIPQRRVLDAGVELLEPVARGFPAEALAQQLQRFLDLAHKGLGLGAHVNHPVGLNARDSPA